MVNLVVVLVFSVEMNRVLHAQILEWISGPCFLNGTTVVIFQCTVFPPGLRWLCTCLPVMPWCVGHAIFTNIVPQNYRQPRWNLLSGCHVSIVPGSCLRYGIHKVTGVVEGHHVWFLMIVVVHTSPWFPEQRCIYCETFPWGFFICVFLWDYGYLHHYVLCFICAIIQVTIFDVNAHVSLFDVVDVAIYMQFNCG